MLQRNFIVHFSLSHSVPLAYIYTHIRVTHACTSHKYTLIIYNHALTLQKFAQIHPHHAHAHTHTLIHPRHMCAGIHIHAYTRITTHTHTLIHPHHTHAHTCIHSYTHVTRMHTYTYTNTIKLYACTRAGFRRKFRLENFL